MSDREIVNVRSVKLMDYQDKNYKCAVVRFHFNALKKSLEGCHDEEVNTALARMDGYLGRLEAYFERKANEKQD